MKAVMASYMLVAFPNPNFPNPNNPFALYTDASDYHMGGILEQEIESCSTTITGSWRRRIAFVALRFTLATFHGRVFARV
jgi:hypothetical protein